MRPPVTTNKNERRIRREKKTIKVIVELYCRHNHESDEGLCEGCRDLLAYSNDRLDECPLASNKPTCLDCTIHCYERSKKEEVRAVMRYSGPRMLLRHPILAIHHLMDGGRRRTAR